MTDVLVVSKVTTLSSRSEFFAERLAQGGLTEDQLDRLQKAHQEHSKTLQEFTSRLDRSGMTYEVASSIGPFPSNMDVGLVVAIGGDGTVLSAARAIGNSQVKLVGLRSSRLSVGYLCAYDGESLYKLLDDYRESRMKVSSVSRLAAEVTRARSNGGSFHSEPVLNDFLFANASPASTSRYRLSLNAEAELQLSSGIWFATAVGSTAAIHAAGGTRVPYRQDDFQFLVREPMQRQDHRFQIIHGFFDPDHDQLSIENRCDHAILASDGGHASIAVEYGDVIKFKRASPLQLVIRED